MAPSRPRHAEAEKRAEQRATRVLWGGMLLGGVVAVGIVLAPGFRKQPDETVSPVDIRPAESAAAADPPALEELRVRVLEKYPHAPDAFTQGLLWYDGAMYESTGKYGESSVRKVRLEDGAILQKRDLEPRFFGEGLARVGNRLLQLTWRSGRALVWNLDGLRYEKTLAYPGEGWGLCFDGATLIMSDGSSILELRDPDTMALIREVTVTKRGRPVSRLNELECVDGAVYANVWQRHEILRIDPVTGVVTATIDASGLLGRVEAIRADVLNGIAYRPESKTFLLTGKLWPYVFEVELVPR